MFTATGDSCAARFDRLLALDHSRQEPWGSRHGLAFAVFALQHPTRFPPDTATRALELLDRIFVRGEPMDQVLSEFRARGRATIGGPSTLPAVHDFAVTIADLGDFAADHYVADLERWCRATVARYRA